MRAAHPKNLARYLGALPQQCCYYSWGIALVQHGNLNGAAAKFKDAHQKGPHWADPLKAWGDVLVKQGHPKEALVKYDEALRYAPNWTALKEAREVLLKQKT